MKAKVILIIVLVMIGGLAGGYFLRDKWGRVKVVKEEEQTEEDKLMGGDRDVYGCLTAGGYSFDDQIGACIRDWELNETQREAAKLAVEMIGREKRLTVIEVNEAEEEGGYKVEMQKLDGEKLSVEVVVETGLEAEEKNEVGAAEGVESALRAKHGWAEGEMEVTVNQSDGQWASGGVRPTDPEMIGGAMWFAGKVDGNWQVIWDGNGTVMCDEVDRFPVYVPTSLISECWDEASMNMVSR